MMRQPMSDVISVLAHVVLQGIKGHVNVLGCMGVHTVLYVYVYVCIYIYVYVIHISTDILTCHVYRDKDIDT